VGRPRVGIVTGLKREAACFRRGAGSSAAPMVSCGAGPEAAARAARELVAGGCFGLISFGFAGALSPELAAGTLIIPETVLTLGGERFETHESWRQRVLAAAPTALTASIVGVDAVAASQAAKAALNSRITAVAVDTESHAVGRVAAGAGLPFLVVRAVSDRAGDAVPGWLLATLDAGGDVSPPVFAAALLRDPRRLAVVLALFLGSRKALARLRPLTGTGSPLFHL
jgi:adenosylhomocysteine nucleosidase